MTDGYSNGGDPVPIAEELRQEGVVIFTIGRRSFDIFSAFKKNNFNAVK